MITGDRPKKISHYYLIDRNSEGLGQTVAGEGEELWGIPYQFQSDFSTPFVEHRKHGIVVATVNCADVSMIFFSGESST